jgi:PKD repeat protein
MSRRLSVLSVALAFFGLMAFLSTEGCHKKSPTSPSGALGLACSASPTSGRAPLRVQFTAKAQGLSDEEQRRVVYSWTLGDGSIATAATVAKDYLQGGTYNVTMTATHGGDTAVWKTTIQVDSDLRILSCSAEPSNGNVPLGVQFRSRVEGNGQNPITYAWNFGDGGAAGDAQPSHTYQSVGNYTARLTAQSAGSSAQCTVPVGVFNSLGLTCSASPTSGNAPLNVSFDANADAGGNACTYAWDFDDGKPGSDQKSPTHRYDLGRFHHPTVTVTCGTRRGTCTQNVEVIVPLPTPTPGPTAVPTASPTPTPDNRCLVITGATFGTSPFYNPGTTNCWPRDPATTVYADGSYSYCWNIGFKTDAYFVRTRLADAGSTTDPYITFTVNVPVTMVIGVDDSGSDCTWTGTVEDCPEYTWMNAAGFNTQTSWGEWIEPIPSGTGLFVAHQATHTAPFPAGPIALGPPGRTDPSVHTYVVVVIPARTADTCTP